MTPLRTSLPLLAGAAVVIALAAAPALRAAPAPTPGSAPAKLELWARSALPAANGAFTADGKLVVSQHPIFRSPSKLQLLTGPTTEQPFPDASWQTSHGSAPAFDSVQGLRTDSHGVMWIADMGGVTHTTPKLVAWDTRAGKLARIIPIASPATIKESEPQDLVIDEPRQRIYLADEAAGAGGDGAKGALIVVDLKTGASRRVLQGVAGTKPEPIDIVVDRRPLRKTDLKTGKTTPMRAGADGIALDAKGEWLYFGPLNGHSVYRVRTADLNDASLSKSALAKRVERYAERPNAGGYLMDAADNLYLTEIEGRAIGVIAPGDRRYRRMATHPDMLWPDGLTAGPDGRVYVVTSQLPNAAALNGGRDHVKTPFPIFRFQPLAAPH